MAERDSGVLIATPLNILIAEDNADDVVLLGHAFQKAGFAGHLSAVSDGVEALAYLEGEGVFADRTAHPFPDFLLLDLNMPQKNGFEVLASVRTDSKYSRLMVHVLTASSRPADVERAYDLHANSYTVKPSRLDQLVAFAGALLQWHTFIARTQSIPKGFEEASSHR